MKIYESLGKLLQEQGEYEKAIVCFKKLLQIAWFEDNMNMETRAYECLSLQHFYLQHINKANFYQDRAFRGKLERETSCQKKAGITARKNYMIRAKLRKKKNERQNTHIRRTEFKKINNSIVMSYTALREIEKEIKRGEFSELSMEQMIERVCNRKIGCGIEQVNIS